jgi:hypothetical protein
MSPPLHKLFLSHAAEDKLPFVRGLAEALLRSFSVWYDEYSLPPGASIFQSISAGLAACDFGVVVLSKPFFTKKWTQAELGGLFARESATFRRIIPVWKDVSRDEVAAFSPILADRRAANASDGAPAVVSFVSRAIDMAERPDGFVHTATVATRFSDLGSKLQSFQASRSLFESAEGSKQVVSAQNVLFDLIEQQAKRLAIEAPQLGLRHKRGEFQGFPNTVMQMSIEGPGNLTLDFEGTRPHSNSASGACCKVAIFRLNRDWRDAGRKATILEDLIFNPGLVEHEGVSWKDAHGNTYGPQQLCDFAFERFYEHMEQWRRKATGG